MAKEIYWRRARFWGRVGLRLFAVVRRNVDDVGFVEGCLKYLSTV